MIHRNVRALSRGLVLIREMNLAGPSSVGQLAARTHLNRTTCYRLLHTLQQDGFVTFDEETALFALTSQVRALSAGLSVGDLSSQAALPPMFALLKQISWPSDFAVFERGAALIHESTHAFSTFSVHRSMVGRRRSLVRSALGRAMLTAAEPAQRRDMLEIAASFVPEDAALAQDAAHIGELAARTRRNGYAFSIDETETGISAIALPVRGPPPVIGALNIVFFTSAMTPETAARRYLPSLRKAVDDIEAGWRAADVL